MKPILAALLFAGAAAAPPVSDTCKAVERCLPQNWAPFIPGLDHSDFVKPKKNEYWPMTPGSYWIYEAKYRNGKKETIVVNATHETITLMGVKCTVFSDVSHVDGVLRETTRDYYAADVDGNIWYFGEDSTQYFNDGTSSTEGSWRAGVKGALPGVLMMQKPLSGFSYRQEYSKGTSEDMAMVMTDDIPKVTVTAGTFHDCLQTLEWSPLEPDAPFEHKYYAKGVGNLKTVEVGTKDGFGNEDLVEYFIAS